MIKYPICFSHQHQSADYIKIQTQSFAMEKDLREDQKHIKMYFTLTQFLIKGIKISLCILHLILYFIFIIMIIMQVCFKKRIIHHIHITGTHIGNVKVQKNQSVNTVCFKFIITVILVTISIWKREILNLEINKSKK